MVSPGWAIPARLRSSGFFPALAAAALGLVAAVTVGLATPGLADAWRWWAVAAGGVACVLLVLAAWRASVARQAARMRRDFAAGMSHDLRTPLAQIQLFTEMLLMHRDRTEEQRAEWLGVIEREAHALGILIDNLLLLAGDPEAAAFPARERVDLGTVLEDVAAEYADRATARGMRIIADPPEGVLVEADPRAMRQTVANLLDNAIRFGPTGQRVVVSVRCDSSWAEMVVEDQGPGLPAEEQVRLLHPARHLERPVRATGGRGLGLAVVSHVIRAHGGHASVDQADGGGARVTIVLPLACDARIPAVPS